MSDWLLRILVSAALVLIVFTLAFAMYGLFTGEPIL